MDFKIRFRKLIFPFIIFLLALIVFVLNYDKNTWLTGWDNTHPEFNFALNIERTLSTWRQNRGLGLVDGMSHPAHLFLNLQWLLLSFFMPLNMVRYFWQILMFFLGGLGIYFFSLGTIFAHREDVKNKEFLSFLGALFYMFNLSTVQVFYVPLETFTAHFGFIPWFSFLGTKYISSKGEKKYLMWFLVISLLSSTQAFTATVFFVFLLLSFLFFFAFSLLTENRKVSLNLTLKLLACTLLVNLYWIFPFIYYFINYGSFVPTSLINILASEDSFLMNMRHANIGDLPILKSFLFTTNDYDISSGSFVSLMAPFLIFYQRNTVIPFFGYIFVGILSFGGIFSVISTIYYFRKDKKLARIPGIGVILFSLLAICWFLLWGSRSPLSFVYNLFLEYVPFFGEAFRFPFTKVGIFTSFLYSVLFVLGTYYFQRVWKHFKFLSLIFPILFILWVFPVFQGNFFYKGLRVEIPNEYFELFDWSKSQSSSGRILSLPMHTHWSWRYHTWGYKGSGFTWFGLRQPLMDRAFDIWNPYNQEAYYQFTNAIYSNNYEEFTSLMKKYNILWVLDDSSIIAADIPSDSSFMGRTFYSSYLENSEDLELEKEFGFLKIYRFKGNSSGFLYRTRGIGVNYPGGTFTKETFSFNNINYWASDESSVTFPFVGVSSSDGGKIPLVRYTPDSFVFSSKVEEGVLKATPYDDLVAFDVSLKGTNLVLKPNLPSILFKGDQVPFRNANEYTLSLPVGNNIVKINDSMFGPLAIPGDTSLGTVYIDPKSIISIATYDYDDVVQYDLTPNYVGASLNSCFDLDSGFYEFSNLESGFKISTKGNNACIAGNIPAGVTGLASITVDAYASKASYNYCLYDEHLKIGCYNDFSYLESFFFIKDASLYPVLHLYVSPQDNANVGEVSFQKVFLNIHPLIKEETFQILTPETTDFSINEAGDIFVKVPYYKDSSEVLYEDFSLEKENVKIHECNFEQNVLEGSKVSRAFRSFRDVLSLVSKERLCLSVEAPKLPRNSAYMLFIEGEHISGRNQTVCVQNKLTGRCDFIHKLISSPEKEGFYVFFVPPMDSGLGYTVIIENVSIYGEVAENIYDSVVMVPVPYNFLRNIRIESAESLDIAPDLSFSKDLGYTQKSKHFYTLSGVQISTGELIILNQGYDSGWIALCGLLPCPAKHVKVNNWANGWVFEGAPSIEKIILIFWPQILQYLGFLALLGTFGGVVFLKKNKVQEEETFTDSPNNTSA